MSSSFWDKTFRTVAIDSGRAGSWLLNLVDTLHLQEVVLEIWDSLHRYFPLPLPETPPGVIIPWGRQCCLGLLEENMELLDLLILGL
jgi:hypothetical protein